MTTLEAHIHGRTFRLGAPEAERDALAEAIAIVEAECLVIAQKQPTAEIERVLLLAALELAQAGVHQHPVLFAERRQIRDRSHRDQIQEVTQVRQVRPARGAQPGAQRRRQVERHPHRGQPLG